MRPTYEFTRVIASAAKQSTQAPLVASSLTLLAMTASPCTMRDGARVPHLAGLNFVDCFAYEAAKEHSCPLLYVGDDFSRTDVGRL